MANQTILHGLKTQLNTARGLWVEELHSILWAYRTIPRIPIGETPFNLIFRTEAMIPLEIGLPSTRVEQYVIKTTLSVGELTWTSFPNSDMRLNSAWLLTDREWPDTTMLKLSQNPSDPGT